MGVKYFSGTATYTKDVQVSAAWVRRETRLVLDLGNVKEIAEVSVNGRPGILWTPPFRADVTEAVQVGVNHVEIKVTNLWTNRMIGDQELPPADRYTFSTFDPYDARSPFRRANGPGLLDSGLLGPVTLQAITKP